MTDIVSKRFCCNTGPHNKIGPQQKMGGLSACTKADDFWWNASEHLPSPEGEGGLATWTQRQVPPRGGTGPLLVRTLPLPALLCSASGSSFLGMSWPLPLLNKQDSVWATKLKEKAHDCTFLILVFVPLAYKTRKSYAR